MRFAPHDYLRVWPERVAPVATIALAAAAVSLLALWRPYAAPQVAAAPAESAAGRSGAAAESGLPPLRVRLLANADGKLQGVRVNDRALATAAEIPAVLRQIDATLAELGAGGLEVELDCDYRLSYESIMTVTAALGEPTRDGRRLVERIKFAPPRGK